MPKFTNVSPMGELDLIFNRIDDADGSEVLPARLVNVKAGETFECSAEEAKQLVGQESNWAASDKSKPVDVPPVDVTTAEGVSA